MVAELCKWIIKGDTTLVDPRQFIAFAREKDAERAALVAALQKATKALGTTTEWLAGVTTPLSFGDVIADARRAEEAARIALKNAGAA